MSDVDIQRIAAKAVIARDGKLLLLRESATYTDGTNVGRYHLPGGRVEIGEPFFEGLAREVKEETSLDVTPVRPLFVGEWWPTIHGAKNQIIGVFMLCKVSSGKVKLSQEHDDFQWADPRDHDKYQMMDSEVGVFKAYLESL